MCSIADLETPLSTNFTPSSGHNVEPDSIPAQAERRVVHHTHLPPVSMQDACHQGNADNPTLDRRTSVTDVRHPCPNCRRLKLPSWPCEGCLADLQASAIRDHGFALDFEAELTATWRARRAA